MTRTEKFIQDNKRVLLCGRDYYNPDTSFMKREDFDKKQLKVLVVFPTPSDTKAVSTTKEALNDFVIEHCPNTFIDFCFIPNASDIKLFDKHSIPYAVGLITHLDASHYDMIGFSISVLSETITMASIINSFQRCDKPIDLTWSERKDKPLGEQPIIFCGGITAVCGDIMYGELGDGRQAFSDFTYLGECGKLDVVFRRYLEARATGSVTRSTRDRYVYGYAEDPKELKYEPLVENVKTNQDFIDSLFDLRCIYQPQAYEVKFNDKTQIISNKKINPKAQDWVKPLYPHEMSKDLGIGRAIINASGENCGTTQTQVSEGCSAAGCCSFKVVGSTRVWTDEGLMKIEDAYSQNVRWVQSTLAAPCKEIVKQIPGKVYRVSTKDGHYLDCDLNHRFLVVRGNDLVEKTTKDLQCGDVVLRKIGSAFDGKETYTEEFFEFLGFMHGDGCFDQKNFRWKIYMSDEERPRYEYLFRKFVPTSASTRVHYKGTKGNIWVIEGNIPEWVSKEDFAIVTCDELYVPECVFRTSKKNIGKYLRGVFQADGWFTHNLGLTSISKRFIDDVAILLSYLGIDSSIRTNEYFKRNTVQGHKVSYYLLIPKDFQQRFLELVGFHTKNHEVTKCGNRTKANLDNIHEVCALMVAKFDREQARSLGIGDLREAPRHKISDMKWRLASANVDLPGVRGLVGSGEFVTDVIKSVEDMGYTEDMYDVLETQDHYCVYNTILTHNCAEGNYTGGWCEKPREQILKEIREAKKYSAGYKYKPFSFNCNYVTDYKGMLHEFIQRYPKVTFINMRMEELGRDVDAIKMMKLIGSNRISAPMEGISPRIQNQLLNKCLSEEALNAFMDDMVHAKMGDIKVGGIFTGYEEDEDFQWICDFVDKFKKRAQQEGGNFPFRLKVTPLVHYNLTPCEYLERKSARKSYAGEHWLTDEWYEKFREHNVFFKVNGFRYSTFLEQSIIDLGRKATHIVYEEILKKGVEVYSLRSVAKPEIIQAFKDEINPDYFFEARDPEHYISLSHRIHIDLMGSYIPRARRLIRAYKNGNIFDNEADIRCLKTYDGAPTKCYKMCAAKDPLKIYNDVEMDEEGNLHGEYRLLLGCERCHDNEARKARLARPTPFTKNSNDILAAPRMKKVQRIRFVIQRNKEYDVLNPNNTAHTFIAKLLQRSDTLLDSYHSMNIHSMAWQSDPNIPYVASGTQIVDTIWTKPVYKEVQSLIEAVNLDMQSLKILKASEIFMDDKLDCDDFNIFRFETRLPYDLFATSSPAYKGEVKIKGDFEDTIKKDPKCKAPVFIQAGKVIGYFALPFKYNPILYMQQFLNAKKVTVNKIVQEIDFECIMQVRPNTNVVCKNCHEEQATVSLTTGKNFPFGTQCLCKALLSKEMQK